LKNIIFNSRSEYNNSLPKEEKLPLDKHSCLRIFKVPLSLKETPILATLYKRTNQEKLEKTTILFTFSRNFLEKVFYYIGAIRS